MRIYSEVDFGIPVIGSEEDGQLRGIRYEGFDGESSLGIYRLQEVSKSQSREVASNQLVTCLLRYSFECYPCKMRVPRSTVTTLCCVSYCVLIDG
jgi:hypothetical protein